MTEPILRGYPLVGVELQAALHQVEGLFARAREHLVQLPGAGVGQLLQHGLGVGRFHGLYVFRGGAAGHLDHPLQLVHGRSAWEDRLAREELPENAANAPLVNTFSVRGGAEEQLGGAVPARGDVVREHRVRARVALLSDAAREPKIADLHLAVGVQQDVRGLDVAMEHLARVHVLQRLQQLVDDVLLVNVLQDVGTDDGVQIRLHVVADEVDVQIIVRLQHVEEPDDVLVPVQLLQEHNLPESPLRVRGILEGVEALLQGHHLVGLLVDRLPNDTVGPATQLLHDLVLLEDVLVDLLAHLSGESARRPDAGGKAAPGGEGGGARPFEADTPRP
mmetsp:Transcript_69371/g.187542  ORF Transcript_69371/g.187542 Transcript_69371/m.187542 type:complete len:334 (-) Transcript_69371:17-1018(-)